MKFEICCNTDLQTYYFELLAKYSASKIREDRQGNKFVDIEINSLEELMQLQKEAGYSLIIMDGRLEIYDGYRE